MSCYISVSLISENKAYIIKYILSAKHVLSSVCDLSILVRGLIETYSADYAICQRLAWNYIQREVSMHKAIDQYEMTVAFIVQTLRWQYHDYDFRPAFNHLLMWNMDYVA